MDLDARLGVLLQQRADAARLRATEILADDAAGRQVDGVVLIDGITARTPRGRLEVSPAVAGVELLVFKKTGSAGMLRRRTRPEDSLLGVDFFVRDAEIIGHAALGGNAELFEDLSRRAEGKLVSAAEPVREVDNDFGIAAGLARWRDAGLPVNHATFGAAGEAFFFLVQTARENDVSMAGSFAHEEVNNAQEFKP